MVPNIFIVEITKVQLILRKNFYFGGQFVGGLNKFKGWGFNFCYELEFLKNNLHLQSYNIFTFFCLAQDALFQIY